MIANFHPDHYARLNGTTRPKNVEALQMTRFRRPATKCEQMLDIGCGPGDFTRDVLLPWSKPCRKMVAVDSLPGMIDYAEKNYAHPDICYEILDAATPDISEFLKKHGKFDRIYSFYCLHWIKDQKRVFTNMAKMLKDDGECLLLFVAQFVLYDVWVEMAAIERWKDVINDPLELFPDIWLREPRTSLSELETRLRQLVADAGMDTISCTVFPEIPCLFHNPQGALDMMLPIVTAKSTASIKDEELMRKEMAKRLIESCDLTPTSCSFPMDIFILHTQKRPAT